MIGSINNSAIEFTKFAAFQQSYFSNYCRHLYPTSANFGIAGSVGCRPGCVNHIFILRILKLHLTKDLAFIISNEISALSCKGHVQLVTRWRTFLTLPYDVLVTQLILCLKMVRSLGSHMGVETAPSVRKLHSS